MRKSFRYISLQPKAGVQKKLSYIKQTQAEPGAGSLAVRLKAKPSTSHLRFGSYIGKGTIERKCNAHLREFELSHTASTNNNFNFLVFLSKPFKTLHAHPRHNETRVPRCLTSKPYNSTKWEFHFLPRISERLILSHGQTAVRRFFAKDDLTC